MTNGAARIEVAIRRATSAGRPALAAFLTAGFPQRHGFAELLRKVSRSADLVEVGVPFSDPLADGASIQEASRIALANGVTIPWILEALEVARVEAPPVLMSYLNPLLAGGLSPTLRAAADAGVAGLIIPDLPFEECAPYRRAIGDAGMALIQLVTPLTPQDRLRRLCGDSEGFVYAVTSLGTTGGEADTGEAVRAYLDRVRKASPVPVLAGFGIREAGQVDAVRDHVDGIIVGSALVETLRDGADPAEFLRRLLESPDASHDVDPAGRDRRRETDLPSSSTLV